MMLAVRRALLAALIVGTVALPGAAAARDASPSVAPSANTEPVSWLAVGDSYSSGEGIEGTGLRPDDQCAQSTKAFGPRAAAILGSQRGWDIHPVTFVACTGAITGDYFNHDNQNHASQDAWASELAPGTRQYDVITSSFGGNDVDFAGIMKACLVADAWTSITQPSYVNGCDVTDAVMRDRIDKLIAGTTSSPRIDKGRTTPEVLPFGEGGKHESLAQFYADLANKRLKPGGILVVAGYPRIFAPGDQWPDWRHGRCGLISKEDADLLGRAAEYLDSQLAGMVNAARGKLTDGRQIRYTSRLKIFDNHGHSHSLCTADTEWMNGTWIALQDSSLRAAHLFHPNRIGHQVTAEHVAATVAKYLTPEALTPSPTPTPTGDPVPTDPTTPTDSGDDGTISDGTSHFGIGDPFDLICYVAWPTAPTYTSNSIEMTMACPELPKQYLFAHVSYPDPELAMTPSTGNVRVIGTIVNTATSAYGFKELIVDATRVEFDP
jgi:hypothetical protein